MPAQNSLKKNIDQIMGKTLMINEIFFSLQGESTFTGLPTVFIRLTGCPLRCQYCDTEYAFYEGSKITIKNILIEISRYRTRYVTVTGGEPLAQKGCIDLLSQLCDEGYQVSLETSGAMDIGNVDERVCKIFDIKTPGSGEARRNRFGNLKYLASSDQIKFVICNETDYEWTKTIINDHQLHERCSILLSPSYEQLKATTLADWLLRDQLPVRMQIQLHKYLWGDVPGR
jgi:7-carboxy-7-deazaguanine synthase